MVVLEISVELKFKNEKIKIKRWLTSLFHYFSFVRNLFLPKKFPLLSGQSSVLHTFNETLDRSGPTELINAK